MFNIPPEDIRTISIHGLGTTGSSTIFTVPDGEIYTAISGSIERGEKSPHTYVIDALHPTFMSAIVHTSGDAFVKFDGAQQISGTVKMVWSGAQTGTHHWSSITYVPYNLASTTSEEATTTVVFNGMYDGANFQEWLFVAGVFLFFISWLTWSRISFTKEN